MRPSTAPMRRQWRGQVGQVLEFVLIGNWGGQGGSLGLTGLQVLDAEFRPLDIYPNMMTTYSPKGQMGAYGTGKFESASTEHSAAERGQ